MVKRGCTWNYWVILEDTLRNTGSLLSFLLLLSYVSYEVAPLAYDSNHSNIRDLMWEAVNTTTPYSLPPLRPCHSVRPPPPQQRLIPRRPSGGLLWRTPPVDADQCPLLGSRAPHADVFPTCAAGGTWLGCGLRGVGDGAPRDCP